MLRFVGILPIEVQAKQKEAVTIPPLVAGGVAGLGLVLAGGKKQERAR